MYMSGGHWFEPSNQGLITMPGELYQRPEFDASEAYDQLPESVETSDS
jgi:hypothetical protein